MQIIYLVTLMNMLILSKPQIDSYKEENGTIYLTVSRKSEKCGFIDISKENGKVTFQFACGWYYSGKGFSNLNEVDLVHEKENLTLVQKTTKRKIFKLKCERELFDKIMVFLDKYE